MSSVLLEPVHQPFSIVHLHILARPGVTTMTRQLLLA
jgi:hypothetical protein